MNEENTDEDEDDEYEYDAVATVDIYDSESLYIDGGFIDKDQMINILNETIKKAKPLFKRAHRFKGYYYDQIIWLDENKKYELTHDQIGQHLKITSHIFQQGLQDE